MTIKVSLPTEYELNVLNFIPTIDQSDVAFQDRICAISLGAPLVTSLDGSQLVQESPQLADYLSQRGTQFEAKIVLFPCSFGSFTSSLANAALAVSLTQVGEPLEEHDPVAWSIESDVIALLGQKAVVDISLDLQRLTSLIPGTEESQSGNGTDRTLLICGEGTSYLEWQFSQAHDQSFYGDYWLGLIALIPVGMSTAARFTLTASINRNGGGAVPYLAILPERLQRVSLA